jgi:hypothetical protein
MAHSPQQMKRDLEQKVRAEEEEANPLIPLQWAFAPNQPISAAAQANNEKLKAHDMRRLELRGQKKGGKYN